MSARVLYELDQFFWHAEILEVDELLPLRDVQVENCITLLTSSISELRAASLVRLNAWLIEAARDLNLELLRLRCQEVVASVASVSESPFGRSLELILQASEATQSAQTRHLLNVVFLVTQFFGIPDFHAVLARSLPRVVELPGMPIRKFLKIFEKGISEAVHVPEYALFPDKTTSEDKFPLSHPRLSNFRSFVLLAKHHHTLVSTHPAPPPAIREAQRVIENWYAEFFTLYRMHAVELNYLRHEPTMHEAFVCFARHKNRATARPKLFEEISALPSVFQVKTLLRNSATAGPNFRTSDAWEEDDARSECSDISVSQNLIEELREFSDQHFPAELLKDISLWFDKISDHGVPEMSETPRSDSEAEQWSGWVQELTGIFLRLHLSACKHSTEYPHFLPVDQDRLLLHAALELRNFRTSELAAISAEAELRKNADVIAGAVAGIFLRALEFPGVGDTLVCHNGLLVLLKYANGFEETDLVISGSQSEILSVILPESRSLQLALPSAKLTALYRSLTLLWNLVKTHPGRVRKFILPFRSVMIMKRLMRCTSYRVQRVVLKIFKIQVRFLPKKLKHMSVKFVSHVFVHSNLVSDPYDDWMLTTALSVASENSHNNEDVTSSSFAVHQGPESVAGETEKQEDFFEVKEELEEPATTHDDKEEEEDLKHVNWKNPQEVNMFCGKYGHSRSQFFFGYSSFDEWLQQDVLLSSGTDCRLYGL